MNGPSEWTESIAAQDFDFESADVDFAGCRGSLNALRGRVLASAHRADARRRTRRAVCRLVLVLVCGALLSSRLTALADVTPPSGTQSVTQASGSEWELVEAFVRVQSRHRRILSGACVNEPRQQRQLSGVSAIEGHTAGREG